MAELLTVFILQLLIGTCRPCLLQRTSAGLRSVHPGGNITLHCDITVEYEIWWYHQSSEEMKLLITAGKGKLSKSFSLNYNLNEDHYDGIINPSSVDLVIVGVGETDLGLYYCGGRNNTNHIQFGKAIRLNFTGGDLQSNSSSAQPDPEPSPDPAVYWITIMILTSVCLVQMTIISLGVVCYRVNGRRCSDPHPTEKVSGTHLLTHLQPRAGASEGHAATALDVLTQTHPLGTRDPFTAVVFEGLDQK